MSFDALGLTPELLRAVADQGYTEPTPVQREAIPLVLAGRDLLAGAQTGTGKTAAFVLPMLQRLNAARTPGWNAGPKDGARPPVRALVLTPTRELCLQVEESVRTYGAHRRIRSVAIYGGVGYEPQNRALRQGPGIIVATPGRLLDHIEQGHIDFRSLEILVLDEADRMLDMGFAPQINRIVDQIPPYRQTLLFSATMPPEVEALARKYRRRPKVVQIGRRSSAANTVTHAVYPVSREKKSELLVELLKDTKTETVLVFTRTKHGADKVVHALEKAGVKATAMHADKTQAQRIKALEQFRNGEVNVLVATDIAQRGLDISGITHVVNYDVPQQPEDYIHRIGRTGRAATTGDAFTFMSPDEIAMVRSIENTIGSPIPRISVPGYDFGTVAAD
jgi:ATP-dependent RNA helicase RhlE